MKFDRLSIVLATLCVCFVATEANASNRRGNYSVDVMIDGAPAPVHMHNGRAFIAGAYGSAYQIRVQNQSGRRIEAIVAVDGRDVVTGQPVSPRRHRGYIIPAFGSTTVEGFRSSTASVAAFRFSTIPGSYAWRTGTRWGIGTIRVWVYEEAAPVIVHQPPVLPYGVRRGRASRAPSASGMAAEAAPQAMGTAYGEQRWSPVSYTSFVRRSRRARTVLGLRYNSWEMLAAAGIVMPVHYPTVHYPTQPCVGYCYSPPQRQQFAPPPPVQNPRRIYAY